MVNFHFRKMTDRKNRVGVRLKRLRECKNLTQAFVAARCGASGWDISENIITKIERGYRCVTDLEIIALAKALKIKPKDLFDE